MQLKKSQSSQFLLKPPPIIRINKRKDPGKSQIPISFQNQHPPKAIKTINNTSNKAIKIEKNVKTINYPKNNDKFVKPKIIWKSLNKFNIKTKFMEILNFFKTILKKTTNFLKESQNLVNFQTESQTEYTLGFEKLKVFYKNYKEKKAINKDFLEKLQEKKGNLKNHNKNLKEKIEEFKRLNNGLIEKMKQDDLEYNLVSEKNNRITEKFSKVMKTSNEINQEVFL